MCIDGGLNIAIKNNIKVDVFIGDKDSVNKKNIDYINSIKSIILPEIKDLTDTEYAIKYFNNENITIYTNVGKRIEHFYLLINLCFKYKNIKIITDYSYIKSVLDNEVILKDDYKYISFFSDNSSIISLDGFKYNLFNYKTKNFDSLMISNELINNFGIVKVNGNLIMIKSKSDFYK